MYKVKCPPDIFKNPCPGVFLTELIPEVTLKCGLPFNTEVYDYVYDQYTCTHTWKVKYIWFCVDCDGPGCNYINPSCCYIDDNFSGNCLIYSVTGYGVAYTITGCTGSELDYKVNYDFVDTCGKKHKCSYFFHGAAC